MEYKEARVVFFTSFFFEIATQQKGTRRREGEKRTSSIRHVLGCPLSSDHTTSTKHKGKVNQHSKENYYTTMGCHTSKFSDLDDSIHVMLSRAEGSAAYFVPQAPHPLLVHTPKSASSSSTVTAIESDCESDEQDDDGFLLFHAAHHHNETIDLRDVAEYYAQTTTSHAWRR